MVLKATIFPTAILQEYDSFEIPEYLPINGVLKSDQTKTKRLINDIRINYFATMMLQRYDRNQISTTMVCPSTRVQFYRV